MLFRVIAGQHVGLDKEGRQRTWLAGEVVEPALLQDGSELDLRLFNGRGVPPKFERVDEVLQASPGIPPIGRGDEIFDEMNIDQLRQHAAEEEIDLGGAKTRDEVLSRIKSQATTESRIGIKHPEKKGRGRKEQEAASALS